jgi:hypothetical protein
MIELAIPAHLSTTMPGTTSPGVLSDSPGKHVRDTKIDVANHLGAPSRAQAGEH